MPWATIIGHSALFGFILSILFTALLFTCALISQDFLVNDYPPAIRDRYGPKSPRGRKTATVASVVFAALTIAALTTAVIDLHSVTNNHLGFGTAFLAAFVLTLTFNIYDLLILDWLIVVGLRPRLVVLPGTEGMAEYNDLKFHAIGFVKGLVFCLIAALLTATSTTLIEALD